MIALSLAGVLVDTARRRNDEHLLDFVARGADLKTAPFEGYLLPIPRLASVRASLRLPVAACVGNCLEGVLALPFLFLREQTPSVKAGNSRDNSVPRGEAIQRKDGI